ncbi:MAG: hypothetical protein PHN72_06915 [Bacilli bacterium]|nr:hypothetical protein [Bacilli bacterium]
MEVKIFKTRAKLTALILSTFLTTMTLTSCKKGYDESNFMTNSGTVDITKEVNDTDISYVGLSKENQVNVYWARSFKKAVGEDIILPSGEKWSPSIFSAGAFKEKASEKTLEEVLFSLQTKEPEKPIVYTDENLVEWTYYDFQLNSKIDTKNHRVLEIEDQDLETLEKPKVKTK